MATISIRVDDTLKKQAETLFSELGLTLSTATTAFYKQAVRQDGMPFRLSLRRNRRVKTEKTVAKKQRLSPLNWDAFDQLHEDFKGVAEELGNPSEEEIQSWVDEVRYPQEKKA
jgi:DNA-damage-inducible protein J